MAKFNIINKAEKLVGYILVATNKFPKKLRCDIVPEVRKQGLRIIEDIIRANMCDIKQQSKERIHYQKDALSSIRVLEAYCEICENMKYLTSKQLQYITKISSELFDMILKWIASDENRCMTM